MTSPRDENPIISMEIVERPFTAASEDMWDQLVDLCETDADFEAVVALYDQATSAKGDR
jgi:hypothetical protein